MTFLRLLAIALKALILIETLRRNREYGYAAHVVIVACGLMVTALVRMVLCKMRLGYLYRFLMSRH